VINLKRLYKRREGKKNVSSKDKRLLFRVVNVLKQASLGFLEDRD